MADGLTVLELDAGLVIATVNNDPTPEETAEDARRQTVEKFLSLARKRFRTVAAAESVLRRDQLEDLNFRFGGLNQWSERSVTERADDERPILTINRIPQFIRQVLNSIRSANLAVKVLPADDKGDLKTAHVFQGIIRHIEAQSDAQVAYGTAAESQTTIGRGWWRVVSEFEGRSWVQDLYIRRIRNPFTVYMDPAPVELDGSDARYLFIVEDMPNDEFDTRYGEKNRASLSDFETQGDMQVQDWMPEGKTRIAEYWYIEEEDTTLHLLESPDGEMTVTSAELDGAPEAIRPLLRQGIKRSRPFRKRTVFSALISSTAVLEGNEDKTAGQEWPGKTIPVVPVLGDEIDINGRVDYRGMVRDAKDPQRLYNFQNTALAEALALAPLAQWVGYEGQFEGHEKKWRQANRRRYPYLEVKATEVNGRVVPLPSRITSEPPIQAIVRAIAQHNNDLQATMGLYDPSLGNRVGQQSGKAIAALQKQGEIANSNFLDNLSRSIRATGRILVDIIPKFYDAPRVLRILGPDEIEQTVMVHANQDPSTLPNQENLPEGIQGIYNIGVGKYDVVVSVGPSLPTKRAEAAQQLTEFVTAYPAAFPIIGDLIVKNMDWPGADAAYERLRRMVPPQFQGDDKSKLPPEAQAQIDALNQQLQQVMQQAQMMQQALETKQVETEAKASIEKASIMSKERLAQLDGQIEIAKIQAQTASDERLLTAKAAADAQLLEAKVSADARVSAAQTLASIEIAKAKAASDAEIVRLKGEIDLLKQAREHRHELGMSVAERVHEDEREDRARADDRVDQRLGRMADRTDRQLERETEPPPKA